MATNKVLLFSLLILLIPASLVFGQKNEEPEEEAIINRTQKNEIEQRLFGNARKHELIFEGYHYYGNKKEQTAKSFLNIQKFIYSNFKMERRISSDKKGTVIIQFTVIELVQSMYYYLKQLPRHIKDHLGDLMNLTLIIQVQTLLVRCKPLVLAWLINVFVERYLCSNSFNSLSSKLY